MTITTSLADLANGFVQRAMVEPSCREFVEGWVCTVELLASDTDDVITIHIEDNEALIQTGQVSEPNVRVTGSHSVLSSILTGHENPTALYLDGMVDFEGNPRDEMRIDVIWESLFGGCGEPG